MTRNKVFLVGNLGRDPEVKSLPVGTMICNASIATKDRYKQGDEWKETTEWHDLVAFGKLAEIIGEAKKGDALDVEGSLQTRSWEDKEGNKKSKTSVKVSWVTIIPSRGKSAPKDDEGPF